MRDDEKTTASSEPTPAPAEPCGRRDFLANALRLGGGVFAIVCGADALGADPENYDWEAHRWA
jgi:hypothetical protein